MCEDAIETSPENGVAGIGPELDAQQLRTRIDALTLEVTMLRKATKDRDGLEDLVAQLREANQNLVLATVNAQTLRDQAEATNRRQNEFLAMLAHELRNPLAPIGMAAMLLGKMPDASPQLLRLHNIINRQVEHLARLLDDLLDAARISSGKITLLVEPVLLADIIERTIEAVQGRIDERRQQLDLDVPAHAIVIEGDQVRLTQVFSNLLLNASKFTQDCGHIALSVQLLAENVIITVRDDGAGMSAEVIPHIFTLFTQGPRSLARSEGGLGVGLNVVHNIVHMHGGKVEASSMGLGCGSVFTVTLPLSVTLQSASPAPSAPTIFHPGYRMLLIEDNIDACTTLKNFLALEGHAVSVAHDGLAGLALACEHEHDVLICDIGLPGMDGFEIIKQLRQSKGDNAPFAIALSGYGQANNHTRALAAGFDAYLVKPVDTQALLSLVLSNAVRHG